MAVLWLILRLIGIILGGSIALAVTEGAAWVIGICAGLLYLSVVLFILEKDGFDGSPKSTAILSFIGTLTAAIVRVAIGGAPGICFYVVASITNSATCYCIGFDDVINDERRLKEKYYEDYYDGVHYVMQKQHMQQRHKFWQIVNCSIFGVLALIGCFKPFAAFLPLIYIILRSILVWLRNR